MFWTDAGRAVFAFQIARLLANDEASGNGDSLEVLHGMRGAAARLRAALCDFGKATPKEGGLKPQEVQPYEAYRKSYRKYDSSKFRRKIEKELDAV